MARLKKQNKETIVLIITIVLFALAAIFFSNYNRAPKSIKNAGMLEIPRIIVNMTSKSDGSEHILTADFYLDASEETINQISTEQVQSIISATLSDLDYDYLNQKDSLGKVVDILEKNISDTYSGVTINKIYTENFVYDYTMPESNNTNIYERFKIE